jgi:OPT family oligopeptide transporter
MIGAAVNTVLGLRQPSINLGVMTAQLLAYLLGKAWARWVPSRDYDTFRLKWNLNPGPFNVKEHSIIGVMVGVSFHTAFATDIILAQVVFYKQDFGMAFQVLLVITTQSIGYGIAGLLRKFLIYPAAMIWPESLVAVSLMHAMHDDNEELDPTVLGGNMSRFKWFGIIALVSYL